MRVTAIGGCGRMGRYAVRTVLGLGEVDEVVVADLDPQRATAFVNELEDRRAHAFLVDVADAKSLRAAVEGSDVVLNTSGPFYRFGVAVLKEAIAVGAHYLDICDDWEPTLEMLDLSEDAERAGVTAVVGLGASPGVSNLLAAVAMQELDEVDTVITGWGVGRGVARGGSPSAAVVHWVHQCAQTIRVTRDGKQVDEPPLRPVVIDYPGIGQAAAWTVGHPEAITLPRARPDLRTSVNVMVAASWIVDAMESVVAEVRAGRMTAEDGAQWLVSEEGAGGRFRGAGSAAENDAPPLPPLFAYATGRRGSRQTRVAATVATMPPRGMGGATGVPLGVGVRLLLDGKLARHGVLSPEEVVDPRIFFGELARRCAPPLRAADDLLVVSVD